MKCSLSLPSKYGQNRLTTHIAQKGNTLIQVGIHTPVKTLEGGGARGSPLLSPSTPFALFRPIPPISSLLANSSAILFNTSFTSLDLDRVLRVLDSLSSKLEQSLTEEAAEDRLLQLDQELAVDLEEQEEEEEQLESAESIIRELHLDLWCFFLYLQQQQQVWHPPSQSPCDFLPAAVVVAAILAGFS